MNSRLTLINFTINSRAVAYRGPRGRTLQPGIHRRVIAAGLLGAMAGLVLCSFVSDIAEASSKKTETLQILVTDDDGVGAPGINATVKALTALPDTKVTVVAPRTNQSGTGAKVTAGKLKVTNATTASGYPAKAVAGYPADTIIWAIDDHGISRRPNLVVSGSTLARTLVPWQQSLGQSERRRLLWPVASPPSPSAKASTTANRRTSLKVPGISSPGCNHTARSFYTATKKTARSTNGSLNVPTCATGRIVDR